MKRPMKHAKMEINRVESQKNLEGDSEHEMGGHEAEKDGMKGGEEREVEEREESKGV